MFLVSKSSMNQSLSTTLLKGKEKFLYLKNQLISTLKTTLINLIKTELDKKYSTYIEYLLNSITKIKKTIDKSQDIELILNHKDYNYFIKKFDKILDIFKNPVEINEDRYDFIGGFKISLVGGVISYDYLIDTLSLPPFAQIFIFGCDIIKYSRQSRFTVKINRKIADCFLYDSIVARIHSRIGIHLYSA